MTNSDTRLRMLVVPGDITTEEVDAIVNAANTSLLGGGGVDGAIHRAAGPDLLAECRSLGGCPTGEARITAGYELPARYVIHTVGPVWNGGKRGERELLASCYRSCLELAAEHTVLIVSFPAISCGVYGFPLVDAAHIAVSEVNRFLQKNTLPHRVRFVCFDERVYKTLRSALDELFSDQANAATESD